MTEHTHKQFDAEMEAIRSGVLDDGRPGRDAARRARSSLLEGEDGRRRRSTQVGADEQAINQMQIDIDQQCSQIIAKRQPAAIDLRMILTVTKIVNDLERVGDEAKKIAYKAAQTRGSDRARAGALLRRRARRRARAARCCSWRSTRSRASTSRGGRGHRPRRRDRRGVLRDPAPAHQLHDGRPAHDQPGARDRVHRQVDRAHRRPREEHRRGGGAGGEGQGRAARDGRADPRGGGARSDDDARRSSSSRTSRRSSSCCKVNLVDAGYEVQAAADAETAQALLKDALPDLVLLDWMLPGQSGLAFAKQLRADARTQGAADHHGDRAHRRGRQRRRARGVGRRLRHQAVLAARAQGADQGGAAAARAGSGAGAAGGGRAQARSRRRTASPSTASRCTLGPTEFRLLRFLLARPERVHSRAQLLDQVWGDHVYIEERTVDVHIRRLRLALEPFGVGPPDRDGARQRLPARRAALSASPPMRRHESARSLRSSRRSRRWSLALAPRRCAALAWSAAGARAARARLGRDPRITRAARSPHATGRPARSTRRCPKAAARGATRSPRCTGACACASRTSATSRTLIERFQQRGRGDSRRHRRARRANRIEWANRARAAQLGLDLAQDIGASRSSTSCASPSSCATSRPATIATPIVIDSQRDADARSRSSSCRSASTRSC